MAVNGNILIVDDDADMRDSLRLILEGEGYVVRMAANGREALRALEARLPDLMILDVMMNSDTEGFDLAFELRASPRFNDLPIILLTSFLDKVREDGPDAFQHILGEPWPVGCLMEKPVDSTRLLAKMRALMGPISGRGGTR